MLIRFFKSSFYLQYLFLLVLAAALWVRAYTNPCHEILAGPESPLFLLLSQSLPNEPLVFSLLGFIFLLGEAFLLNYILIKQEIAPKNTLIPAIVFIVLMSQSPLGLGLNPVLCSGLFIILAFDRIMNTYGQADPTKDVFSAAFLLALASLLYFPAVFILLLLFLSFIIFGTFSIRIFLVYLSGIIAVYLYLVLIYFLTDSLGGQYSIYQSWFLEISKITLSSYYLQYIVWGGTALLLLAALYYSVSHLNEWNISIRKKVLLIIWFIVLTFSTIFYEGDQFVNTVLLSAIPVSILISNYLTNRRKITMLIEVYFILLLVITAINNIISSAC